MKSYAAIYRVTLAIVLFLQFQVVAAPAFQNDRDATKTAIASGDNFSNRMGSWIWTDTTTHIQFCNLWTSFNITAASPVKNATLWITADDEFTVYLDGRSDHSRCNRSLREWYSPGIHGTSTVAASIATT